MSQNLLNHKEQERKSITKQSKEKETQETIQTTESYP
jgi:hypothetical protein